MKEINNLIYALEINYVNKAGMNTSISIKFHDNGLKVKSISVGNVCITEETINGRVLSGRIDNSDGYCGYRYNYRNGENLLNINPNISLDTAISLIGKAKRGTDFLSAELVLSSILRNDYRVLVLDKGNLNVTKTVSAENEKSERCSLKESVNLIKLDGEEMFVEQGKKRVYQIEDNCLVEEVQAVVDDEMKGQFNELSVILSQNPKSYKTLIKLKNQIQKNAICDSTNEEKCYE